ncbi:putative RNase toxin 15 of polymorphic toxin system [Acinetobacter calcoaceticus]|uniref:Putative RNase toxin 15 of polymorphic toxin system n=1 Tax=Acinetobacter calcoaceticus TaxID=471 RepID=A0A4R1XEF0_ACICA|nr:putative RNase toxin 15 of polymorphic toxin system [Acinetobacter calcoaceticus]
MKEAKVKCFNPVNNDAAKKNTAKMIKEDYPRGSNKKTVDQYLKDQTDTQLANQQKGLNEMSVDDYVKGREAFQKGGRGSCAPAAQARKSYQEKLRDKYRQDYEK